MDPARSIGYAWRQAFGCKYVRRNGKIVKIGQEGESDVVQLGYELDPSMVWLRNNKERVEYEIIKLDGEAYYEDESIDSSIMGQYPPDDYYGDEIC